MVFCNGFIVLWCNGNHISHNPYFSRWFSAMFITSIFCWCLESHNPYFSRWFSAMGFRWSQKWRKTSVTILILVDGFLQYNVANFVLSYSQVTILILVDGFLQYMNKESKMNCGLSHNPYFSRWFSAIIYVFEKIYSTIVTILILVDGFLQSIELRDTLKELTTSQSLF